MSKLGIPEVIGRCLIFMNKLVAIADMKFISLSLILLLSSACVNADTTSEKQVVDAIMKKCFLNATQSIEEEVCKAKRPAIEQCVINELSQKDSKTAKLKCEFLYLPPKK